MATASHLDHPLVALRNGAGDAPRGELISRDGRRVCGRLLGVRIWPARERPARPQSGQDMVFFCVEVDQGQMMVPLGQISTIRLLD